MLRISPKVDFKLLNQITKNIFYINTSTGIAYSFITINNKSETEHLSGIGGSFDFIPTFNIGKTFSLGIGSWNNLVFHSKSNITRKRTSTYTKFGFQMGFKV